MGRINFLMVKSHTNADNFATNIEPPLIFILVAAYIASKAIGEGTDVISIFMVIFIKIVD